MRINNINQFWLTLLITGGCLISCSDDEEEGGQEVVFPESVTLSGEVGGSIPFVVDVNGEWQLSSNQIWCALKLNEDSALTVHGAGKNTVMVYISDEARGFIDTEAKLTLKQGGKYGVVAIVPRESEGYKLFLTNRDGVLYTEENPIIIGASGKLSVNLTSNFDWAVIQEAEWLEEIEPTITDGKIDGYILTVKEDYIKYPQSGGHLQFMNGDSTVVESLAVSYEGMADDAIIMTNVWNLNVSADGKSYERADTLCEGAFLTTVTASMDNYFIRASEGALVEDDKQGNLSVTFQANESGEERVGYVLVFPTAINDSITQGNISLYDENGELKQEFERYVACHFVQACVVADEGNMEIMYSTGDMQAIPVIRLPQTDVRYEEYKAEEVCAITIPTGKPILACPNFDGWLSDYGEAYLTFLHKGEDVTWTWFSKYWEPMEINSKFRVLFTLPEEVEDEALILFKTPEGTCKKILVVRRN